MASRRAPGLALVALITLCTSHAVAQDNFIEYEVKKGDTCIKIARKVYGDGDLCYELMANSNEFDEKFRIYPGQVLKLPTKEQIAQAREGREKSEPTTTSSSPPPAETPRRSGPDAKLKRFRGNVTARSPEAESWEDASRDKDLWRRWRVNSADRSSAEVFFLREKATLRMRENTLVVIYGDDASSSAPSTTRQAVLEKGTLASRLGELSGSGSSPAAELQVETPTAVVTSKGGDTLVSVMDGKTTLVANHTSKSTRVRGRKKAAKEIDLPENMGSKVEKDKDPTPPKPLPEAPTWTEKSLAVISAGGKSLTQASWQTVPDAAAWRIEVRKAEDDELIDVKTIDARFDEVSFEDFTPGHYVMRIATIDNDGFESKMSQPLSLLVSQLLATFDDPDRERRYARGDLHLGEELVVRDGLDCTLGGRPLANSRINASRTGVQELLCRDANGGDLPPQQFVISPNVATLENVPVGAIEPDTIEEIRFALEYPIEEIEVTYPEGFEAAAPPSQEASGTWVIPVRAVLPKRTGELRIGTPGILGATLATVPLESGAEQVVVVAPEVEKPFHFYIGAILGFEDPRDGFLTIDDFTYDNQLRGGFRAGVIWRRQLLLEGEFDTGFLLSTDKRFQTGRDREQSFALTGALSYRLFSSRSFQPFLRLGGGTHLVPGLDTSVPRVLGGGGLVWVIGRRAELRLDLFESLYFHDDEQRYKAGFTGGFSATF